MAVDLVLVAMQFGIDQGFSSSALQGFGAVSAKSEVEHKKDSWQTEYASKTGKRLLTRCLNAHVIHGFL